MLPAPKKRLGQNFLRDGRARQRIIDACGFAPDDTVLEIGPGRGAMTPLISARAGKVYAVELDSGLAKLLQERFEGTNVSVINRDILSFDLTCLTGTPGQKIKVFGNIPYYITSPIIEHLLGFRGMIGTVFLTVQKEFARRVCAGPGTKDYGSFSCYAQYYTEPRIMFDVKRNSFFPVPKVDSSFLSLRIRERPPVTVADEERLFRVIRAAFQQRRKTIRNSLKNAMSEDEMAAAFSRCGISPSERPERLSLSDFARLSEPARCC